MDVTAIVLAIVAVLGTIYTNRDKWRFDARMLSLEAESKRIPALEAEVSRLKAEIAACHAERDGQAAKIAALEATNARQQKELDTLKRELVAHGWRADSTESPKG